MTQSTITIEVFLDDNKVPQQIQWKADAGSEDSARHAKALMLSLWDGAEKTAMRIDLWNREMMVDEMADFYYQTLMTMADSFNRATHQEELVKDMKAHAREFYQKFRQAQLKENKL